MARQGRHRKFHVYSATVRPWIWLLSRAYDCRIFQGQTIPAIIKDVFRKHGLTDFEESLTATYTPRDYVVQYRILCKIGEARSPNTSILGIQSSRSGRET